MAYCRIHGREFEQWEGCLDCRDAELRAEQDRATLLDALEQHRHDRAATEYSAANPGEYECPECKYIALRRAASRCPKCQGTVPHSYWLPIFERERRRDEERQRERQRAADEWARGEPKRQLRAREAAAKARIDAFRGPVSVIALLGCFTLEFAWVLPAYVGSDLSDSGGLDSLFTLGMLAIPTLLAWAINHVGK